MNDLESLIQRLDAELLNLRRQMDRPSWGKFVADLEALAPRVDAVLDAWQSAATDGPFTREQIDAYYDLEEVCLQYPAVRGILPRGAGLLPAPPRPRQPEDDPDGMYIRQRLHDLTERARELPAEEGNQRPQPAAQEKK